MAKFIEVHALGTKNAHLININHIVEVIGNTIYTDDFMPSATDFPHCDCTETYEEIKQLIHNVR